MGLISKITRRLNFDKKKKYDSRIKGRHDIKGNLFYHATNGKKANYLRVIEGKKGIDVCLRYEHDSKSTIVYHFKYNRDNLLLLRGVSVNNKIIISDGSIPDFAIGAKPFNKECKFEWVPAHERVKGVSLNNQLDIKYDDKIFKISQKFNAVNPSFPREILWEHNVTHEISIEKPFLEITNGIVFLQDTEINKAYLTMLPANTRNIHKLYLSNGDVYNDIPNDGSSIKADDTVSSAMYVGNDKDNLNYIAAVETDKVKHQPVTITFRGDRVTKFYLTEFSGLAKKDDRINHKQRIVCVTDKSQ